MITSKAILKSFLANGEVLTEDSLYAVLDSYFHKNEDLIIPSEKILIVDSTAEEGTGIKGDLSKPFDKIYEAIDEAESGDFILVRPGTHFLRNQIGYSLAKPGIHIHFMPCCAVYYGYTVFNSTSEEWVNAPDLTLPFRCTGMAEFINYSDAVFKRLLNAGQTGGGSNTGVDWCLEFYSFRSNSNEVESDTGPLDQNGNPIPEFTGEPAIFFQDVTGTHDVRIKCHENIIAHNKLLSFQSLNDGSLYIDCSGDLISEGGSIASVRNNGPLYVKARNIISSDSSSSTIVTDGNSSNNKKIFSADLIQNEIGTAIEISHTGRYIFRASEIISEENSCIINTSNANILIDGSRIICHSEDHPAIQRNTNTGSLTLKDCFIEAEGDESIDSSTATTVNFETPTRSNKSMGSGVTAFNYTDIS